MKNSSLATPVAFALDPDDLVGVDVALDFPLRFVLPDVVKGFQPVSYTHLTLPTTPYV